MVNGIIEFPKKKAAEETIHNPHATSHFEVHRIVAAEGESEKIALVAVSYKGWRVTEAFSLLEEDIRLLAATRENLGFRVMWDPSLEPTA